MSARCWYSFGAKDKEQQHDKNENTHVKHDSDGVPADSGSNLGKLLRGLALDLSTKAGVNELLAVGDHEVPGGLVGDVGDLDDLGETVLCIREKKRIIENESINKRIAPSL